MINPPKRKKKQKKIKEDIIFKAKEEEVIISEEELEPEPWVPPPKKFDKEPKGATIPQVEPEPAGVEPEPEVEQVQKKK